VIRRSFLPLLAAPLVPGQEPPEPVDFVCPMDPEVHSKTPGRCPRCGMLLQAGLPDSLEYRLAMRVSPRVPVTTGTTVLDFSLLHPKTGRRVEAFREIHERLFHLFVISEDLSYFAHEHPEQKGGGRFEFRTVFPKPGFYRLLADCYPSGGTPQLLTASLYVGGTPQPFATAESAPRNLRAIVRTEPRMPIAGFKTMVFFRLDPFEGVKPWLGAWGHLLCASADLIDLVHLHPAWEPYENEIQFNLIFPRPGKHRLWAQFERLGVVNTIVTDVTAAALG
jgi:hypothetical protein